MQISDLYPLSDVEVEQLKEGVGEEEGEEEGGGGLGDRAEEEEEGEKVGGSKRTVGEEEMEELRYVKAIYFPGFKDNF